MEMHEIVNKLIGPSEPDDIHFSKDYKHDNLCQKIALVDKLVDDLVAVSGEVYSSNSDAQYMGREAQDFLETLHDRMKDHMKKMGVEA